MQKNDLNNQEKEILEESQKEYFDEAKSMSIWSYLLFYGGQIALLFFIGFSYGITAFAITLLVLSCFFTGYLAVAYTTVFEIGKFAKSISMLLVFISLFLLIWSEGWLGLLGIIAVPILTGLSISFWDKRVKFRL